jgi:hypothetical protein
MRFPPEWSMARPGFLIPVFFLCFCAVSGQHAWQESSVSAAGGTFVSRHGLSDGRYNQAGLGWTSEHAISLQHAQPFMVGELGIASLSLLLPAGKGGFGTTLSTFGIKGYRQTSAWISYGMKLHPGISAGVGLHIWNTGILGQMIYHYGVSCALGIQVRISRDLCLAGHVMHPASWSDLEPGLESRRMMISAGASYTFFQTATYHTDLHFYTAGYLQWCHGLEIPLVKTMKILLGMHNRPYSAAGGLCLEYHRWSAAISLEYLFDTGMTPSSSLMYAW